ncbi:conserved hypothetical protein [Methylobacterium sp. 4-46]|uniref:hypothetical protein n=1 Tax=unclassified Methylobacterium TaxID=2615210 RepID=UPI000165C6A2|nr:MULTISPECIES: hypothetical protein [Methylobacterium]ACA17421.1 conserved hypothetical protein [Methylobacterium sp. 4-46]WFT83105.1 hypothetical protein QA634_15265 [Methylobacterium nodulans]
MQDLSNWLNAQQGGVNTYIEFRERAKIIRKHDHDHAALMRLLSDLVSKFIWAYAEEPLSPEVGTVALDRLKDLMTRAVQLGNASAEQQIRLLNEIAQTDLADA